MNERIDRLKKTVENYMSSTDCQLVYDALSVAITAHDGQKRMSGEPYMIHPLDVAQMLAELEMDVSTVCAALLHDVVEDTSVSLEELRNQFGETIAQLVDGVTKLDKLNFFSKSEAQVESMRKMLVAMAKDIRVVLIKLCDRLHNMRTVSALSLEAQKKNAQETLEIYAPIAARLGIFKIKTELENRSLAVLEPEKYAYIEHELEKLKKGRQGFLERRKYEINEGLKEAGIAHEIIGREKHIYSIYRKMVNRGVEPSDMYDIMALRILVNDINDCYAALGVVHTMYRPIPGRFKDYIAVPKTNMYQSLHTSLISRDGGIFEMQIRTYEMNRIAEYGVAAHWKYKEQRSASDELDKKFALIRELRELQSDEVDPHEFLDTVRGEMLSDYVYVFTPKGEVITLPSGSTPIDFAYKIHSKVGDLCVGCKVNGRIVPIDYHLQTGEVVEVLTNSGSKGPSRDWLKIAKTSQAKNRIRAFFKRELKEENIAKGKEMLIQAARRQGFDFYTQLFKPEWLKNLYRKYSFNDENDMYSAVGYGGISTNQVLMRLIEEYNKTQKVAEVALKEETHLPSEEKRRDKSKAQNGIIVKGEDDMLVRLAHCCNPVPGDDIIGFITRGRGVSVHRKDCINIESLSPDDRARLIEVEWAAQEEQGYSAELRIVTVNKTGIFAEVSRILTNLGVSIRGVNAKVGKNDTFVIDFLVQVQSVEQLLSIIRYFRNVPDVIEVYRGANG